MQDELADDDRKAGIRKLHLKAHPEECALCGDRHPDFLTYEDWKANDRPVNRGEKAHHFINGEAFFELCQTKDLPPPGESNWEDLDIPF